MRKFGTGVVIILVVDIHDSSSCSQITCREKPYKNEQETKRENVIKEIITTEDSYVKYLATIKEV